MGEKRSFQLKAHYNSAEVAVGEKLVRLDDDKVFTTSDPAEIRALDGHPAVKAAEATVEKKDGK